MIYITQYNWYVNEEIYDTISVNIALNINDFGAYIVEVVD